MPATEPARRSTSPRRRPKPRRPPEPAPVSAVVLAVDPGAKGGAAVWVPSSASLVEHFAFVVDVRPGDEARLVESALRIADREGFPLVVVAEKWTSGARGRDPRASAAMMAGLAARWGRWEGALLAAGFPKRRIVRVNSQTWQARVIGTHFGMKSEERKVLASRVASNVVGRSIEGDAADAVCIALWARRAGEIADVVPRLRGGRRA